MMEEKNKVINKKEKLYDIFISYSAKDRILVEEIVEKLRANYISVWYAPDFIFAGASFAKSILNGISSSRMFVPIITGDFANSVHCLNELEVACSEAKNRSKSILPIVFDDSVIKTSDELRYHIGRYQWLQVPKGELGVKIIVEKLCYMVKGVSSDAIKFEKLSEYISAGVNDKATELLCELIIKICDEFYRCKESDKQSLCLKLISYLEKMADLYELSYNDNAKVVARRKLEAIDCVCALRQHNILDENNTYYISAIIRMIYWDRTIRYDCADAITGGDVSEGVVEATLSEEKYADKQSEYVDIYRELLKKDNSMFSKSEMQFILATEQYIYDYPKRNIKQQVSLAGDAQLLQAVANFTREGNKLFDAIGDKQPAKEFLQCLLMSYERLKNYCIVVGAQDICAECIERISELKQKLDRIEDLEIEFNDRAENGIKSLLGLTESNSGKYDVFISHKNEDYDIALDIYEFLKENLKESFLDKKSLPEMSESKYRKAIMRALDGSKHFVVVFSNIDYLQSDWVSLEMEVFQAEQDEGRKPESNFLMIVTEDVYNQIIVSRKSILPIEYRRCEIIKLDDYKNILLNYLNK